MNLLYITGKGGFSALSTTFNWLDWKITWTLLDIACLSFCSFSYAVCTTANRSRVVAVSGSGLGPPSAISWTVWPISEITPTPINWKESHSFWVLPKNKQVSISINIMYIKTLCIPQLHLTRTFNFSHVATWLAQTAIAHQTLGEVDVPRPPIQLLHETGSSKMIMIKNFPLHPLY